jgi:hypothetical protein
MGRNLFAFGVSNKDEFLSSRELLARKAWNLELPLHLRTTYTIIDSKQLMKNKRVQDRKKI